MPPPRQDKIVERVYGHYKILGYYGTRALRSIIKNVLEFVVKRSRNKCAMTGLNIFPLTLWGEGVRRTGEGVVGCQSNVQHKIDCHPELVSEAHKILKHRGQSDVQKMLKQVQHDGNSPKRTYSHINLFTYSLSKRTAFTLAEVLITLGIIGVVAALTMPALITNYQKKVTATRLKAAYSQINQAIVMAQAQHGETGNWEKDADKILLEFIAPNLKTEKYSKDESSIHNYTNTMCNNKQTYKFLNGGGMGRPFESMSPSIKLANGVCISLNRITDQTAEEFFIDINGPNPPNINGKDLFVFSFRFNEGKIVPAGDGFSSSYITTPNYQSNCNKDAQYGGSFCAKVIMDNGWEIPKDYPW